jgi:hypothetical protein
MNIQNTNATQPDDSKSTELVTVRLPQGDKTDVYWIAQKFKCSMSRIFRESLWMVNDSSTTDKNGKLEEDFIKNLDPFKCSILLEDSDETAIFTTRLTPKERANLIQLAEKYGCTISSVFRAGLRLLIPVAREKIVEVKGPSFFR